MYGESKNREKGTIRGEVNKIIGSKVFSDQAAQGGCRKGPEVTSLKGMGMTNGRKVGGGGN